MKHNSWKPNVWLVSILAALFVAQAPLCAFACLGQDSTDSETRAASESGCHESAPVSSPTESSSDSPVSHDDCGCDIQAGAIVAQSVDATSLACPAILLQTTAHATIAARAGRDPSIQAATDLPPPDILLLHSILIL